MAVSSKAVAVLSGIAAGAAMIFGLASAPTAAATPGSRATSPAAEVTVAEADHGSTVTLQVGQTLAVSLSREYGAPAATGTALTRLSTTGGHPTRHRLAEVYRAAAAGSTELATTNARTGRAWTVTVEVRGSSSTGSGQTVTVTQADNQRSIALAVGDVLVVDLPAMYLPPTVTPSTGALSLAEVSGGYPTPQPLIARYLAVGPGQADVTTISDAACNHEPTPCPSPQVPWSLHVTVS
jgi:hypothetical protein